MPAMGNITVNNFAAGAVTYTVLSESGPIKSWADTAQGTPQGFRTISLEMKRPADPAKGVTRVLTKVARPVVNATTGLVDYISRANSEYIIPPNATLAERQELWACNKNFQAHANAQAAVVSLEGLW